MYTDSLVNNSRPFTHQDYKVLTLSSFGSALEFFDFMIFALVAPIISQLFFPTTMHPTWALVNTYFIFAMGAFFRPFGGLFMAHLGDKYGRKLIFTWSLLIMAIPSLGIGLLPTYETIGFFAPLLLLIFRMLQAVAMGSEVPAAWTFVAEHIPKGRVGLANGLLTSSMSAGILLASFFMTLLYLIMPTEILYHWGWRLPFILGAFLGVVALIMRRQLKETPIFTAMHKRKLLHQGVPLIEVWRSYKTLLLIGMGLNWFLVGMVGIVLLAIPPLLEKHLGLSSSSASAWQTLGIFCQAIGCIYFGHLTDQKGISTAALIGATLMAIMATLFYFGLTTLPHSLLLFTYALVAFSAGSGVCLGKLVLEFPPPIRLSGTAVIYNLSSAVFSGISLPLATLLGSYFSWGAWPYLMLTTLVFIGVALWHRHHLKTTNFTYGASDRLILSHPHD